jgi:chaperone modulatory protein CbpM
MTTELTTAQWLHEHADVSIEELAQLSGLPVAILSELVEYGALVPVSAPAPQWRFTAECVVAVRTASRLRDDFELDAGALSVALNLVERIHLLEAELRRLRSQFTGARTDG